MSIVQIGPLIHWSIGRLVHWSIGPLDHCSIAPFVHKSIGPLDHWSIGPLVECQMSKVNKVKLLSERTSGVPPVIICWSHIFVRELVCFAFLFGILEANSSPSHGLCSLEIITSSAPICLFNCHISLFVY